MGRSRSEATRFWHHPVQSAQVGQNRSWSCPLARCTGEGHLRPPMARPPNRRRSQAHRVSLLQSSFLPQVDGEHLRVSLKPCFDAHLGLRLRRDEAERCVRRVVTGDACSWNPKLLELTCVSEACALIEGKLGDLANALAEIAWRPLTPRLVGAALGISGRERARWTKDGRLPHSGHVVARRGNPFPFRPILWR
jgi:hypothetical protein